MPSIVRALNVVVVFVFYPDNMCTNRVVQITSIVKVSDILYRTKKKRTPQNAESVSDIFVIKEHCIFCGKSGDKIEPVKRIANKTFEDFPIWNSVSRDDEWKVKVMDRLYRIHTNLMQCVMKYAAVITNIVDV